MNKKAVYFAWVVMAVGYLFDGFLSNYFQFTIGGTNNFSIPSFLLVTIVLLIPFTQEKKTLLYPIVFYGFLYDLVYIGEIGVYILVFITIFFVVRYLYTIFNDNVVNAGIVVIISLLIKEFIISFIYAVILNRIIGFDLIFERYISTILLNVIYSVVLYITMQRLDIKHKIR